MTSATYVTLLTSSE